MKLLKLDYIFLQNKQMAFGNVQAITFNKVMIMAAFCSMIYQIQIPQTIVL